MSRKTDVVIAGSGPAGLMAAYMAARKNCKVRVISEGMGCLAIGGGYVDLLGYSEAGKRVEKPFEALKNLSESHPYSIIGDENIRKSLADLCECLKNQGLEMAPAKDADGAERNSLVPTILGTLKPTWLVPADLEGDIFEKAQKILVVSVQGFRDCKPALIISQLRRYASWKDKEFDPLVIPGPFAEHGRALNALDLARAAEREEGRKWLSQNLGNRGKNHDLVLMPPLCGSHADSTLRREMRNIIGCPIFEMLAVPPAVLGLRLRDAFLRELWKMDVEFFENSRVIRANVKDGQCVSVVAEASGREIEHVAKTFVVATGGTLSGGTILEQGKAREGIFGLDIKVPENVDDWTKPELLGDHIVTRLGVKVDGNMQALDENGKPCLENVYFAGRTLGGYDWTREKSGLGVAYASGWLAGRLAAEKVLGTGAAI